MWVQELVPGGPLGKYHARIILSLQQPTFQKLTKNQYVPISNEFLKCRFLKGLLAHPGNVVAATLALALTAIALSSLSQCSKSPARELPVSEKNAPFPRALQSNSHNYDPAHDLVFSKLTVSRVFFSGGVFISQTPVSRSIRTQTYPRGAAQG